MKCVVFCCLKHSERRKCQGGDGVTNRQQRLTYNAEEHEFGLLPVPLHFGRYMREKRINFQLPFDLFWLHENGLVNISLKPKV